MMDINQINQIKLETQGNFKELIERYLQYGIVKFQTCASTAKTMYFNQAGDNVYDHEDFFNYQIGQLNVDKFQSDLLQHQQGITDFATWLGLTADSGIAYWIVDLSAKTCVYYDCDNNPIHTELIVGL